MTELKHYRWIDSDLLIQLRVSPRASRDQVGGVMGDRVKIAITAPPVDGKANRHLTQYIAKQFGVPQSQVAVISGTTGRNKTVRIQQPAHLPEAFQVQDRK